MRSTVKVFLGEHPRAVGVLRYNADGGRESAAFEYDLDWLAADDRFSIDPTLQLVSGAQFHKKARDGSIFHPAISDTEPDGWSRRVILRDHAKRGKKRGVRAPRILFGSSINSIVQTDVEELWRRIAYSILITNVDDHLMNHGVLHVEHGLWRLAPAFDLNPFPDRVRELKTWISAEAGPDATIEALLSVAPYFKIPLTRAKKLVADVERVAVARWRSEGRSLGMTKVELESFAPAFEHPEREAARGQKRRRTR